MSRANGFWPAKYEGGGEVATELVQLSSSNTCLAGYILVRDSGNPERADVGASASGSVLGVAAQDRTSGTTLTDADYIKYWPANAGTIFAGIADGAIAVTDIGLSFDISVASSRHFVDISTGGSGNQLRITNIPRLGPGPSNLNNEREVHFKFVDTQYPTPTET